MILKWLFKCDFNCFHCNNKTQKTHNVSAGAYRHNRCVSTYNYSYPCSYDNQYRLLYICIKAPKLFLCSISGVHLQSISEAAEDLVWFVQVLFTGRSSGKSAFHNMPSCFEPQLCCHVTHIYFISVNVLFIFVKVTCKITVSMRTLHTCVFYCFL